MKNVLIFLGGMTIGGAISWQYHKSKYEATLQEEIEALREHKNRKNKEEKKKKIIEPIIVKNEYENDEDIETYETIVNNSGYNNVKQYSEEEPVDHIESKLPYIIKPDEFGNVPMYDCDTLYYHKNDVITNCDEEIIDNVEFYVGMKTLEIKEHYGQYEQDAVYFRNDKLKTDYEVLWDEEEFDEGSYHS